MQWMQSDGISSMLNVCESYATMHGLTQWQTHCDVFHEDPLTVHWASCVQFMTLWSAHPIMCQPLQLSIYFLTRIIACSKSIKYRVIWYGECVGEVRFDVAPCDHSSTTHLFINLQGLLRVLAWVAMVCMNGTETERDDDWGWLGWVKQCRNTGEGMTVTVVRCPITR